MIEASSEKSCEGKADAASWRVIFFLQRGQSVLISLWEITTLKVEGIKKGLTPMSISLGITPTAEFVCNVDKTICPVNLPKAFGKTITDFRLNLGLVNTGY